MFSRPINTIENIEENIEGNTEENTTSQIIYIESFK